MQGPLSPDVYDTSRWPDTWWLASAPAWEGPEALHGDHRTDVAIIGGGYAGLSCARRLADHGLATTVLEAGEVGWGASGRNGGIVGLECHKLSAKALVSRHGEAEVARYHAAMLEGLERLRAFCTEARVPMQGTGEALYAHSAKTLRALLHETPQAGVIHEALPSSEREDMARHGGIVIRPSFGVHPLMLVRALADAAVAAGVRVAPTSPVTSWRKDGASHLLETPRGSLRSRRVVVATNGFTPDGLHPGMEGRAVPVISNIAVTRVLSEEERARHPWLQDDPVCDTRNLLVYLRMLPEGRLLFGMRGDLSGADANTDALKARVSRRLAKCFPGWEGIEIAHFWRGPICATASLTPAVGPLPDEQTVFHAFGWHGSGVNGAQVGGRILADVIAGGSVEAIPAPFRGQAPRLPLPGLRPLYVGAALGAQWVEDALS